MKAHLIVIEGADGSGKETQSRALTQRLEAVGLKVMRISFPCYDQPSSALVRQYLAGDFGSDPGDVNAYAASLFYAADRYGVYKQKLEGFMATGDVVVADRYTMSNMIHQAAKIADKNKREDFLDWLWDLEFNRLALPVPDLVLYLDVPARTTLDLMADRANKITGEDQKDIHEAHPEYLVKAGDMARALAHRYGWQRIDCAPDGILRSVADISDEIFEIISAMFIGDENV